MEIPDTRYVDAGGVRIAYQQFGTGPRALFVGGILSNVEISWESELFRRTLERAAQHLTVVAFDKRGVGLSDRFEGVPTLHDRIGDIVAVMDAVGWDRAHLHGISEGGLMAQLFAAEYPDRVESLGLLNPLVSPSFRPRFVDHHLPGDAPIEPVKETLGWFREVAARWPEQPERVVERFLPSQRGNAAVARWFGRLMRLSASPKDFGRQLESVFRLDGADAPARIISRTQITNVVGDAVVPAASGRLLASLIPNAVHVDFAGDDHFAWCMPTWSELLDVYLEFVLGNVPSAVSTRRFGTVLFTDIVNSTQQSSSLGDAKWRSVLDGHDRITRELIDRHRGRLVKSTGDGLLALFDLPSDGLACGAEVVAALAGIGVQIRAGAHAGEVEVRSDGDISGIAVNLAARVEQHAGDGEFWVSSTMRDLMLGGATRFEDRGSHALKGIDGDWRLFAVQP